MKNDPHSALLPGGSDFSEGQSRKPTSSRSETPSATSSQPRPRATLGCDLTPDGATLGSDASTFEKLPLPSPLNFKPWARRP